MGWHEQVRVKFKVPEYGSRFPSTGLSSQVRVNYKQLQQTKTRKMGQTSILIGQDQLGNMISELEN